MAFIEDPGRVAESTTSTGSGAITVAGAVAGYQRFSAKLSVSDTFPGCIVASDGTWQEGIFTYSGANQITFTTILDGSSGTSPITLPAGTHTVFAGFLGMGKTIANAPGKTTPVGGDLLALMDSADSNRLKSLSITDLLALAGGGMKLLATLTPTAAANLDALSVFSSPYDNYLIIADGIKPATDDSLSVRFANSGVVDAASNYYPHWIQSATAYTLADTAFYATLVGNVVLAAGGGANFVFNVNNVNDATNGKGVVGHSVYQSSATPGFESDGVYCHYIKAATVSGLRFFWSGGANFAAVGKIRIYGYNNT